MLTYTLVFLLGFALFLLGMSIFMYRESRKFGDNQFTMKLLPPPSKRVGALSARFDGEARIVADWVAASPLPEQDFSPARRPQTLV